MNEKTKILLHLICRSILPFIRRLSKIYPWSLIEAQNYRQGRIQEGGGGGCLGVRTCPLLEDPQTSQRGEKLCVCAREYITFQYPRPPVPKSCIHPLYRRRACSSMIEVNT